MIVFSLLLLELVVNLKYFDFGLKMICNFVIKAPEVDEPISFYNWAF
jgi:hypothetical protein